MKKLRAKTSKSEMKEICRIHYPEVTHVGLGRDGFVYAGSEEFLKEINAIQTERISQS